MTRTDLAALVGSRICHDLISPIGAIGNGMELLSLTGGDSSAEMALINDSVDHANARIRFFRIAFGAAGPDQMVGRAEITAILADLAKGGRYSYQWQPTGDARRAMVRCAFLMVQCLETALPLGGSITIDHDDDTWHLVGTGRRIVVDPDLWATLTDPHSDYPHSPAQVQFALLPAMLAEQGGRLALDVTDTRISATF